MKLTYKHFLFMLSFVVVLIIAWPMNAISKNTQLDCAGIQHPSHMDEYRACLNESIAIAGTEAGVDCVSCMFEKEKEEPSSLAQLAKAFVPVAANLLGQGIVASAQNKMQERAANFYKEGYQACTNSFNTALNNNIASGASPILAEAAAGMMNCNGYGYGSFAGNSGLTSTGFGTFSNPFLQNGFSSSYVSGYNGQYALGASSIYNNGMTAAAMGASSSLSTATTGLTTGFTL